MDHRNHVSLYYEGFKRFMENCEDGTPGPDDCLAAFQLCSHMCTVYKSETNRVEELGEFLQSYLPKNVHTVLKQQTVSDAGGKCDVMVDNGLLFEVKNEIGQGDCDALPEVLSYYIASLPTRFPDKCLAPCFLLELVGPHLFISGVVYAKMGQIDTWPVVSPSVGRLFLINLKISVLSLS